MLVLLCLLWVLPHGNVRDILGNWSILLEDGFAFGRLIEECGLLVLSHTLPFSLFLF